MQEKIKVLLIEDDQDLRESVAEWLVLTGMEVTAAGSAAEFYRLLAGNSYEIAIVDIGLPDQSGFVLTEYIRTNTDMAVIILTARNAIDERVKGYASGADMYLVKPVDCRELSAAIVSISQRMHSRQNETQTTSRQAANWTIIPGAWLLKAPDTDISLSAKELEFLRLLAAAPGKPVLRKVVLTQLYQRNDDHAGRALDSLVRRLRAKIADRTALPMPIKTLHAVGYCFTAPIVVK
jgi:DNA-binding response OmpR family regulator